MAEPITVDTQDPKVGYRLYRSQGGEYYIATMTGNNQNQPPTRVDGRIDYDSPRMRKFDPKTQALNLTGLDSIDLTIYQIDADGKPGAPVAAAHRGPLRLINDGAKEDGAVEIKGSNNIVVEKGHVALKLGPRYNQGAGVTQKYADLTNAATLTQFELANAKFSGNSFSVAATKLKQGEDGSQLLPFQNEGAAQTVGVGAGGTLTLFREKEKPLLTLKGEDTLAKNQARYDNFQYATSTEAKGIIDKYNEAHKPKPKPAKGKIPLVPVPAVPLSQTAWPTMGGPAVPTTVPRIGFTAPPELKSFSDPVPDGLELARDVQAKKAAEAKKAPPKTPQPPPKGEAEPELSGTRGALGEKLLKILEKDGKLAPEIATALDPDKYTRADVKRATGDHRARFERVRQDLRDGKGDDESVKAVLTSLTARLVTRRTNPLLGKIREPDKDENVKNHDIAIGLLLNAGKELGVDLEAQKKRLRDSGVPVPGEQGKEKTCAITPGIGALAREAVRDMPPYEYKDVFDLITPGQTPALAQKHEPQRGASPAKGSGGRAPTA